MCKYFQDGYQKLVIHKEILRMRMCHISRGGGGVGGYLLDSGLEHLGCAHRETVPNII